MMALIEVEITRSHFTLLTRYILTISFFKHTKITSNHFAENNFCTNGYKSRLYKYQDVTSNYKNIVRRAYRRFEQRWRIANFMNKYKFDIPFE